VVLTAVPLGEGHHRLEKMALARWALASESLAAAQERRQGREQRAAARWRAARLLRPRSVSQR